MYFKYIPVFIPVFKQKEEQYTVYPADNKFSDTNKTV